ncbi:MAG: V-type ATPase subunit [Treponema sp.]|nr:V-type ATPase subunit [Treponema sp.]
MAMDKSSADYYVYARASGMLARSFVGESARKLFNAASLQELWSLLFSEDLPQVPEILLARQIELKAQKTFIDDYLSLVSCYEKPSPMLVALLHFYDYDNIKEIGGALCLGEKSMPDIVDIRPFNIIDYSKWPSISAMTEGTPLAWLNAVPRLEQQKDNDYRLDCQYISEVWESIRTVSPQCRKSLEALVGEKYRMDNIMWALRLRTYYGMDRASVMSHLAYAGPHRSVQDVLARDAIRTLDWELDSWEQWKGWKYSMFLNPYEEGTVWSIDPRWVASAYRNAFVSRALATFHKFPFTEAPLVCWFVIKQRELDNIRTACEHLRLHMNSSASISQALHIAGLEVK